MPQPGAHASDTEAGTMHRTDDGVITTSVANSVTTNRDGRTSSGRRIVRAMRSPFMYAKRRPSRAIGALALLALILLAIGFLGLYFWFEHQLRSARRAVELGHNPIAIRHLLSCRSLRPDHPEVLLLCARVARRSSAWEEAESLLDRRAELYSDDEESVLERLMLRATRGELDTAGLLLQAQIDQHDSRAALASEALIAGLIFRYRLPEAERQIQLWLEREPNSALALMSKGRFEQDQQEHKAAALETYRAVLQLDPEFDEARLRLTSILLAFHQSAEALTHLEFLRRRLPDNAEVLFQLGKALELLGRRADARKAYDECLRMQPDHAAGLAEMGRCVLLEGDNAAAERYLQLAVQRDPGDATARAQYSLALTRNGKKAEAEKQEEAIHQIEKDVERLKEILYGRLREAPNDASNYFEVGEIALRAGRLKEALRWWQNGLQLDPNHLPTHRALTAYYQETGNLILSARHRAIAQRLSH
jgi:tetratricopeptide (TPR) repeat protein